MEELCALIWTQKEYRDSSSLCFTVTWLHRDFPDHTAAVPGFTLIRADRDATLSGKWKGRGIAVFVNESWCNSSHVTVMERLFSPNIELLAVSMSPYNFPREFSCIMINCVYIPPSADQTAACHAIQLLGYSVNIMSHL